MAGDVPSSIATGKYVRQIIVSAPGPQGPAGGAGGVQESDIATLVSYRHVQNTPATTWTVVHNLNFYPNVTIFNTADDQVEGNVAHTNETTLTITFSSALAGKAHLS
jgi:hypothetical protein